ncbi:hypothetical protein DV735_g4580, partial [Chaetothyriales sp. CBS 134920]
MPSVQYHAVVSIPTLIGSLLSFVASTTTLALHLLFPPKWHFRHALIINLFVADAINSLNNSVSGIAVFVNRAKGRPPLSPGPACTANAYIGQFSVQAIDFNTLIISVVVLLIVRQNTILYQPSATKIALLCGAAWVPSVITTNIGLGLHAYGPVSGNWCWIRSEFLGLRYALTHGWRIAIFLATTAIYLYIYIYLKVTFKNLRALHSPSDGLNNSSAFQSTLGSGTNGISNASESHRDLVAPTRSGSNISAELDAIDLNDSFSKEGNTITSRHPSATLPATDLTAANGQGGPRGDNQAYRRQINLRRMLLLNGYPILYVILWIPGMANRLAESVGHGALWLSALQATTQFIGFANALTYGYNEQINHQPYIRSKRDHVPYAEGANPISNAALPNVPAYWERRERVIRYAALFTLRVLRWIVHDSTLAAHSPRLPST